MSNGFGQDRFDITHLCFGGLGGHYAVVRALCEEAAKDGLRTQVIALGTLQELRGMRKAWDELPATVRPVDIRGRGDLYSSLKVATLAKRTQSRVTLAHTYRHLPFFVAGSLAKCHYSSVILIEHQSSELVRWPDKLTMAIGRKIAGGIVSVGNTPSGIASGRERRVGKVLCQCIPTGVDSEFFSPAKDRTLESDDLRIIFAGRLVEGKRIDLLLEALSQVRSSTGLKASLVVVGDGPLLAAWQVRASELRLGDCVSFTGQLDPTELRNELQAASVYVQPTDGEGLSTSVLQAMSVGLPVVASDVTGMASVVAHGGSGILVPPRSSHELASALSRLSDAGLRAEMGARGRQEVLAKFSQREMWSSYKELIDGLGQPIFPSQRDATE